MHLLGSVAVTMYSRQKGAVQQHGACPEVLLRQVQLSAQNPGLKRAGREPCSGRGRSVGALCSRGLPTYSNATALCQPGLSGAPRDGVS